MNRPHIFSGITAASTCCGLRMQIEPERFVAMQVLHTMVRKMELEEELENEIAAS